MPAHPVSCSVVHGGGPMKRRRKKKEAKLQTLMCGGKLSKLRVMLIAREHCAFPRHILSWASKYSGFVKPE